MSGDYSRLTAIIRRAISALRRRIPGYGLAGVAAAGMFAISPHAASPHMPLAHAAGKARTGLLGAVRAYHARAATVAVRAASAALPLHVVRAGESISSVSAGTCQSAADWTGIYAASRRAHLTARNANDLATGQELAIECDQVPSMAGRAYAPPKPAYVPAIRTSSSDTGTGGSSVRSPAPQNAVTAPVTDARRGSSVSGGTYHGSGTMQQCIISRESGGNAQVVNASGHYGLYQFSATTWAGSGGNPADFGHASVAEQNQVFASAVAARGYSDWAPYDGC